MTPPDSSPKCPDDDDEWTPSRSGGSSSTPKSTSIKRKADDSGGTHSTSRIKKIPVILESFGREKGFGEPLEALLPQHEDSADAVAAFLLFVFERQKVWKRKYSGKRQTLTKNNVLATQWFTNMYRYGILASDLRSCRIC